MEYELGKTYVDRGGITFPEDQFLRWVNIPKSGMLNSPGIRPLAYIGDLKKEGLPAYLILVTHERSSSGQLNPWEDIVDLSNAEILYWGDAKAHKTKRIDDFKGNETLRNIFNYALGGDTALLPPILHFSKPEKGMVKFNGLCVLDKLEISWFYDEIVPVRNYHAHLTILDCESVNVSWLHHRANCGDAHELDHHQECPNTWKRYKKGHKVPIEIWKKEIRPRIEQLPPQNSPEAKILEQLVKLEPFEFEKVIVALFKELKDVTHHITGTRRTGDGGFDFFGAFVLPRPINYSIQFRGEVKRYSRNTAVSPKEVSRLVARLSRQEYGIFVTTSYFTDQTQKEVILDAYPVHLISGSDLVNMLKYLRIAINNEINKTWLESILDKS